mgnify:CR=1 FL=1
MCRGRSAALKEAFDLLKTPKFKDLRDAGDPVELAAQVVAQVEQPARVLRRVVEHSLRQRAHRPVGALMLLVELDDLDVALRRAGELAAIASMGLQAYVDQQLNPAAIDAAHESLRADHLGHHEVRPDQGGDPQPVAAQAATAS